MSIWAILDWILYGLVRLVLYLVPVVKAPRVTRSIPSEWWRYNNYGDWLHYNDDGGYPDEHWCRSWLEMAFGELQRLATDKARPYVDSLKSYLLGRIGYIRSRYSSLGAWVNWLQNAVGEALPSFAANLSGAAIWLYFRLPAEIAQGWRSWVDIWDGIKSSVYMWAMARYDDARSWAHDAISWVNWTGDQLRQWRDRVASWIDHVRQDPYGWIVGYLGGAWAWLVGFASNARETVLGWLGPDWPKLVTFGRDCVSFYYNLWSAGWDTLGEFVTDPRGFVFDRLEQAVMDRW